MTGAARVWHYANPLYDLTGIVRDGANRLVCVSRVPPFSSGLQVPAAVLRGDFRMFPDRVLTQKPGTNRLDVWNGQGYLCYTGCGTYSAVFDAPADSRFVLRPDTKDVFEVFVNGRFAGKRLWDPLEVDITNFVVPGENRLEIRVTSTKSNLLYGPNPSGLRGLELYAGSR